jgi:hypothetical protein
MSLDRGVPEVVLEDGARHPIGLGLVLGRDPSSTEGESTVVLADPSVSKSHVGVRLVDGAVAVSDLGSTNGTMIVLGDSVTEIPPGQWVSVPPGARIEIGDRYFHVVAHPTVSGSSIINQVPGFSPQHATPQPPIPTVAPQAFSGLSCVGCGAPNQVGDRFCEGCGRPLSDAGERTAMPSSPAVVPLTEVGGAGAAGGTRSGEKPGVLGSHMSKLVAAGIVAAVVVFVYIIVGSQSGSSPAAGGALSLPTEGKAWQTELDGFVQGTVQVGSRLLVAVSEDRPEIFVLDSSSGEELDSWRVDADGFSSGEGDGRGPVLWSFGDVVVAQVYESDEEFTTSLVGVRADDGEELWSEELDGRYPISVNGLLYLQGYGSRSELELIDTADGSTIGRATADRSISFEGGSILAVDDSEVEVLDPQTLDPRGEPIEIDDDAISWSYNGKNLFVVADGDLTALDGNGGEVWSYSLSIDDDDYARVTAINDVAVVTADGDVFGVRRDGDSGERVWKESGSGWPVTTGDGVRIQVFDDDETRLLDPSSGDEIVSVRSDGSVMFMADGYLAMEGDNYDCSIDQVEAFDYGESRLWSENSRDACADVLDGHVVLIEWDGSSTDLTYLK